MKKLILFVLFVFAFQQIDAQETEKMKALFGGSVSVGYGVMTGNISDYIGNPFMLPLSGEILYKNLYVQLNLDAGFSKVKKTMTFSDGSSWEDGDQAWHNFFGGNIAYALINNEKMAIAPVVGYAHGYISSKWWGQSDIVDHEPSANYLNVAVFYDMKRKLNESGANTEKFAAYQGIRFTIGAYIAMGDADPYPELYNGSTIYFSVGFPAFSAWKK